MAATTAEAAGSSSGPGAADSYIGSLISLTSKSEIRYEGVLFSINTQESTIGLRNVRSFGTEGREKDGPQVPASDKIYEFILFRGSDIKDLQVKSSPQVQSTASIHNDPAIIQSHYPQAAIASTRLPSGTGLLPDQSYHSSSLGLPRPTFQGSLPLNQPGESLGPWVSSAPPPSTTGSGLAMPMYWQGYYGPSNGVQAQQQTLLRPPPGLPVPPSMQQSMQYPAMNASIFSAAPLPENAPPLLPPLSTSNMNLQSSVFLPPSSPSVSDSATLIPDKASSQTLPTAALTSNLPLASPLTATLDRSAFAIPGFDKPDTVVDPVMPFKGISEPPSSIMETSNSVLNEGATPSLVTPGQFLQPGPPTAPSLPSPNTDHKDVEVVQISSRESPPLPPMTAETEMREPILPLPSRPERKLHGAPMHTNPSGRGGRESGRGNGISRSATRFTEDFDFTAMNEKFNKDEVWGHLGKSNKPQEDGEDSQEEEDVGSTKIEKPVYVKDDFFDSLSCDALDGQWRNGRARFSEQMRRDTETFGDFSRNHGGRGGWGPGRGGRSSGGYRGRGYGYFGRGRGYGMPGRSI